MHPILSAAGSFIGGNWKILGIVGLAFFAFYKIEDFIEDRIVEAQERNNKITELTSARDRAVVEAEGLKDTLTEMRRHEEFLKQLLVEARIRHDEARQEARDQHRVFEDHDFNKIVQAKPGLVEKLANKATQERMDEIESAIND